MRTHLRKPSPWLIILLVIITVFILNTCVVKSQTIPYKVPYGYTVKGNVARVIDGDTFVLTDSEHVRMLGIDTPEMNDADSFYVYYANRAKALTDSLINGKRVKLTFETVTLDMFGRILAYVWLTNTAGKDSLFIQAEQLKAGFARIRYYPKGKRYYDIFYNLRRTAMRNNLGIWSR